MRGDERLRGVGVCPRRSRAERDLGEKFRMRVKPTDDAVMHRLAKKCHGNDISELADEESFATTAACG